MAIDLDKMRERVELHGWKPLPSDFLALLTRCWNVESQVLASDDPVVRMLKRDARNAALEEAAKMAENLMIYTGPGGYDREKEQIIIADKIRRLKSAPPDEEKIVIRKETTPRGDVICYMSREEKDRYWVSHCPEATFPWAVCDREAKPGKPPRAAFEIESDAHDLAAKLNAESNPDIHTAHDVCVKLVKLHDEGGDASDYAAIAGVARHIVSEAVSL